MRRGFSCRCPSCRFFSKNSYEQQEQRKSPLLCSIVSGFHFIKRVFLHSQKENGLQRQRKSPPWVGLVGGFSGLLLIHFCKGITLLHGAVVYALRLSSHSKALSFIGLMELSKLASTSSTGSKSGLCLMAFFMCRSPSAMASSTACKKGFPFALLNFAAKACTSGPVRCAIYRAIMRFMVMLSLNLSAVRMISASVKIPAFRSSSVPKSISAGEGAKISATATAASFRIFAAFSGAVACSAASSASLACAASDAS